MVDHWIALLLAGLSCFLGFAWLALGMNAHWQQVMGSSAPAAQTRSTLRGLGSLGLLLSVVLCFMTDRPSMAILVWLMLLAACAPSVGMVLAWRPRWLRLLWPARATH